MARPEAGTTFWDRVTSQLKLADNGCHEFTGHKDENGYGRIRKDGRLVRLHSEKWKLYYDLPNGSQVLHKCDNPCCININHLFIGNHNINMADKRAKGRCAQLKGSSNGSAKLNEQQVGIIKLRIRCGDSCASIARDYGVTDTNIRHIKMGCKWGHIA
jgi:hypothetical protein